MPLTQDQVKQFEKWFNSKATKKTCPVCDFDEWGVAEIIWAPKYAPGSSIADHPTIPMVQVICRNCHYIMLFEAYSVGLIEEGFVHIFPSPEENLADGGE